MSEKERRRISELIVKSIKGQNTDLENGALEAWADISEGNRRLLDEMLDRDVLMRQLLEYKAPDLSAAWEDLIVKIPTLRPVPEPRSAAVYHWYTGVRRWIAIAAGILIVAAFSIWIYYSSFRPPAAGPPPEHVKTKDVRPAVSMIHNHDLPPAINKLMITLPGGDSLDAAAVPEKGMIIYDNMSIHSQGEGTLAFVQKGAFRGKQSDNKLTTPPGGWYTVLLPDGTKVRLNAASSLSFKTSFGRKERKVRLTGEAYFEVAHKPSPFIVEVEKAKDIQDIMAMGTCFNVSAYKDDDFIKTTMLQGKVRVRDPAQSAPIDLHPGQQYLQYLDGSSQVQNEVDTSQAVGWKNEMFVFKGESLPEVMRQVSRWYGATVVYQSMPDSMRIATRISRRRPLSRLLETIAGLGGVYFTIEDHRIIVSR